MVRSWYFFPISFDKTGQDQWHACVEDQISSLRWGKGCIFAGMIGF